MTHVLLHNVLPFLLGMVGAFGLLQWGKKIGANGQRRLSDALIASLEMEVSRLNDELRHSLKPLPRGANKPMPAQGKGYFKSGPVNGQGSSYLNEFEKDRLRELKRQMAQVGYLSRFEQMEFQALMDLANGAGIARPVVKTEKVFESIMADLDELSPKARARPKKKAELSKDAIQRRQKKSPDAP